MFRHLSQDNKWYIMTVQNSGVSNMFKGNNKIESALYSSNSCFTNIEQGKRAGIRIQFVRGKIRTEVMDNSDVSYRYCQEVENKEPTWDKYYFAVATKNYKDLNKTDMITDIDIHLINFKIFDEELMPIQKNLEAERYRLLMTRKQLLDVTTGKLVGDIEELFSKGIAHEVKT